MRSMLAAPQPSDRLQNSLVISQIDVTKVKHGFLNLITLSTSITSLLNNITVLGISFFLPTIIRTICHGGTTVQQQLLTVPPYIVGAFFILAIPTLSWRYNHRQTFIAITGPTIITGYSIILATLNANIRYAVVFICASAAFTLGAMCNAQVSTNVISDSSRNIAIGTNAISGYVGSLTATWTYLLKNAPRYPIGNSINLACAVACTTIAVLTLLWMRHDNKRKDESQVEGMEEMAGLSQ